MQKQRQVGGTAQSKLAVQTQNKKKLKNPNIKHRRRKVQKAKAVKTQARNKTIKTKQTRKTQVTQVDTSRTQYPRHKTDQRNVRGKHWFE